MHAQETATEMGGTHPTEIHYCISDGITTV